MKTFNVNKNSKGIRIGVVTLLMLTGLSLAQPTVPAFAAKHTESSKKAKTSSAKEFWQDKTYTGSYDTDSTLGDKKKLTNELTVKFTKDNHYIQQVNTPLKLDGIQQEITQGTVKKSGKKIMLTPESTVTAVFKGTDEQKKHEPANYHQSGKDFNNKLVFDGKGQPESYTIKKGKKLVAGKPASAFNLKSSKASITSPKDYVGQLEKH